MARFWVGVSLFLLCASFALAQNPPASDPQALALAAKSIAALSGGGSLKDVTLSGDVAWVAGSDTQTGTGTLLALGTGESRIDLALSVGTRSEIRDASTGSPLGKWIVPTTSGRFAFHNCWTDAVWFFPALSSLAQTANSNFIFSYVGQEDYEGASVQHIRVVQLLPQDTKNVLNVQNLSATDFYLDPVSLLPVAVAFNAHPDTDNKTDIPLEIHFANYQVSDGFQVPFHVQRIMNGNLNLDVVLTNAVFNSGLPLSLFSVQ